MKFFETFQCLDLYEKQIKTFCKVLAFIGALSYLTKQALTGENGYKSYEIVKEEFNRKQKILDELQAKFKDLKTKIDGLSSESLDLDLLEERCRVMLNYSYGDEIVIRTSTISDLKR